MKSMGFFLLILYYKSHILLKFVMEMMTAVHMYGPSIVLGNFVVVGFYSCLFKLLISGLKQVMSTPKNNLKREGESADV
jgi:hypothetical protein